LYILDMLYLRREFQLKVEAVQSFPQPHDLFSLRSFLLHTWFFKISNCTSQRNVKFFWFGAQEEAFQQLQQLLTQAPVLAFPNVNQEFILETDASGTGLGAILAQQQQDGPIAYASQTLKLHEKRYSATELEALGDYELFDYCTTI